MKHTVKVVAAYCAAAFLLQSPPVLVQGDDGSFGGWGSQVIGVDMSGSFVAVD